MYNQQFIPTGPMYGQPNVMTTYPSGFIPSVGPGMPAGAMMNYGNQAYRPGFPVQSVGQWPPMQQQQQQQQQQQVPPGAPSDANGGPATAYTGNAGTNANYPKYKKGRRDDEGGYQAGGGEAAAQKAHNNEIGSISSVVHMRNVTPDVTQLSIHNLAQNFGKIKHVVMLRQMNQALVEMETTKSAQEMVDFFKTPGYAEIDGRRVYVRYSNHQNLTATHHTSRTLLVSMFNTEYDVSSAARITPEIVFHIFANYGAVRRIVVLPKNESSQWNHNRLQALVQFDTKETAESVKNMLQGQPVTLGDTVTFTLDIQFSRMEEIKTTNPHTSLVVDEEGNTQRPAAQAPGEEEASYPPQQWS